MSQKIKTVSRFLLDLVSFVTYSARTTAPLVAQVSSPIEHLDCTSAGPNSSCEQAIEGIPAVNPCGIDLSSNGRSFNI